MSFLTGCGSCKLAKMPQAEEKSTAGFIFFLRFAEIIIVAVLAFAAKDLFELVRGHKELTSPPYNKNVLLSQELVYAGSLATFIWTPIAFGLLLAWKGWAIFYYGLVDLTLALTMAVGTGMQGKYLPDMLISCKKASTWQIDPDHPGFFVLAASLKGGKTDARGICRSFVNVWTLAIVVISFQMLLAYIGIFCDTREYSILNPYRPLTWFTNLTIYPSYWIASQITRRSRCTYRILKKVGRQLYGTEKIEFEKPPKYTPDYSSIKTSNAMLERVFNIEHILLPIASNLHFDDLINLSLASKSIRESVLPAADFEHRLRKLKQSTCDDETRTNCEYCNKQVCGSCTYCAKMPGLEGACHFQHCQPSCTKCYLKSIRNGVRRSVSDKLKCTCHFSDPTIQDHWICRKCHFKSLADPQELQATRNKLYKKQLMDRAQGIGLREGEEIECRTCKRKLTGGCIRFWVCSRCSGECTSHMHPAYARVSAPKDLERGVVEAEDERGWIRLMPWSKSKP